MSGMTRKGVGIVMAIAVILSLAVSAAAYIPKKINYQGRLTDSQSGEPVRGSFDMVFRLYDDPVAGTMLWSETQGVSVDSAGVFSVILGSTNPVDLSFEGPVWLEAEVDGEVLLPRREIVSVPYAFHALDADSLGGIGAEAYVAEDEVGSVTGDMIGDGEITDADTVKGQLQYNDHGTDVVIHGKVTTGGVVDGNGILEGTYRPKPNGEDGTFVVNVSDKGEPGTSAEDTIEISLTGGTHDGYSNTGKLGGGNIQFHPTEE